MDSNNLFPEILSRIFWFLHVEDRKSVRRVCKLWNECCNCPAIIANEKFVFRDGYPMEVIDEFLRNCPHLRSTIEFQGLPIDSLPRESTWQSCGQKIHSLSIIECVMSSETTKNIFIHCSNLNSFKLTRQFRHSSRSINSIFCSPETLDELIQLNVERRKMSSFQLFVHGIEIGIGVLQKIFKIFPCIRNFGTGFTSYTNYICHTIHSGSLRGAFNPALIKELSFNVPSNGRWLQEFANVEELKLEKLETILKCPAVSGVVLSQFLRNQKELQALKLVLLATDEDYTKMMLFRILSSCTNLKDFRFKSEASLKMDEFFLVLRTISKSNFECLMLWFKSLSGADDELFDHNLSIDFPPLSNKTLRTLKLDVPVLDDYCSLILKHFSNLNHLELAAVSDKILQTIFQYSIHLKTLVLRKTDTCTAFGFTGHDPSSRVSEEPTYSISQLCELRHLEIEGFLSSRWIEQTILEFNFPHLKYLRLSLWGLEEEISKRAFEYLPRMIPSVEILILDEIPLRPHQYVYFCKHLQRLKLLLYSWLSDERTIRELFIVRPSLKFAVDLSDNAYFYDPVRDYFGIVNFRDIEFRKSVFCDFIRS